MDLHPAGFHLPVVPDVINPGKGVEIAAEDLLVLLFVEKAAFQPAAPEEKLPGIHDEVAHLVGRVGKKNVDLPPDAPQDAFQDLPEPVPAEDREQESHVALRHLAADVLRYVLQGGVIALGPRQERFRSAHDVAVTEGKGIAGTLRCFDQFRGNDINEVCTPGNDGETNSPRNGADAAHGSSFLPKRVCGWLQERRPAPPILYHFSGTRQKKEIPPGKGSFPRVQGREARIEAAVSTLAKALRAARKAAWT